MSIKSVHPDYAIHLLDWETMRDLYGGERCVKAAGLKYLPATPGMQLDGMGLNQLGLANYKAYLERAVFPDYVKDGVESIIGLLHQKSPTIELPSAMEPLRECATSQGESLELLLRRINEEQLIAGRLGLLLDLPENPDPANPMPYIATYIAETVRNWDETGKGQDARLRFVILDESGPESDGNFEWVQRERFRVLQCGQLDSGVNQFMQALFVDSEYDKSKMSTPLLRGVALDSIPFVFVNSKDILPNPDEPPLLGLAKLVLAIYRSEADYRQCLFLQGQDTLVVIGGTRNATGIPGQDGDAIRVGAGSRIDLDIGGDAKYIGTNSSGLSEVRQALDNDRKRAETKSGQLISNTGSLNESGEALKTRIAAQTATLNQIALTSAAALENILKKAATWLGANPDEVKVVPNLEFADFAIDGDNFVKLMTARTMGAPISKESIHALMVERGLTKMDFETELELISQEDANAPSGNSINAVTDTNGNVGPNADPNADPNVGGQ